MRRHHKPHNKSDNPKLPFWIENISNSTCKVYLNSGTSASSQIYEYSLDNISWTTWGTSGGGNALTLNLTSGQRVYIRAATIYSTFSGIDKRLRNFSIQGSVQKVGGYLYSLLTPNWNSSYQSVVTASYSFYRTFNNCQTLRYAAELVLPVCNSEGGYCQLFDSCGALVTAPVLPSIPSYATSTSIDKLFDSMFISCYKITFIDARKISESSSSTILNHAIGEIFGPTGSIMSTYGTVFTPNEHVCNAFTQQINTYYGVNWNIFIAPDNIHQYAYIQTPNNTEIANGSYFSFQASGLYGWSMDYSLLNTTLTSNSRYLFGYNSILSTYTLQDQLIGRLTTASETAKFAMTRTSVYGLTDNYTATGNSNRGYDTYWHSISYFGLTSDKSMTGAVIFDRENATTNYVTNYLLQNGSHAYLNSLPPWTSNDAVATNTQSAGWTIFRSPTATVTKVSQAPMRVSDVFVNAHGIDTLNLTFLNSVVEYNGGGIIHPMHLLPFKYGDDVCLLNTCLPTTSISDLKVMPINPSGACTLELDTQIS